MAMGQASCTHLPIIGFATLELPSCRHAPVAFVRVKVGSYLVEYVAPHLEEIRRHVTDIRSNNMYDNPFLVFAVIQGRLPIFDLLFDSSLVRVAVLFAGCKLTDDLIEVGFTSHVTT
jgi:hypothetical protein